jgi:hypothetical protein
MSRLKLETLKTILTSEYWLIASLGGAFFSFFALNRGGVVVFIDACFVFLLINLLSGTYRLKDIPASYWVTATICGYLLGASALFYPETSHYRWMAYMVRMLVVVFAVHCLSQKKIDDRVKIIYFIVPSVSVFWQFTELHFFNKPTGTFSHSYHYIASFTITLLPVIFYFFWVSTVWHKFFFVIVGVLNIDILLKSRSRPAIIGIIFSAALVTVFSASTKYKWLSVFLMIGFCAFIYFTDYGEVHTILEELIVNLSKEDRWLIWKESWLMLKGNSLFSWIFGNGIGSFRLAYPEFTSIERNKVLVSTHSFFIDILYESGVIGALLVFGGFVLLIILALCASKTTVDKNKKILTGCMGVNLLAWLFHSGFTVPFYSKYAQYSLAFILGLILAILNSPPYRRRKNVQKNECE